MFILLALAIVVACLIVLTLVTRRRRNPASSRMTRRVERSLAEVYDLPPRNWETTARKMAVPRKRPIIQTRRAKTF